MVVSSAKLTILITQPPVFTPFMSLPNKWEKNFATRTQQNGGYPSLPGSLKLSPEPKSKKFHSAMPKTSEKSKFT